LAARTGVAIGFVREAGTEAPMSGATVSVMWSVFVELGDGHFREERHGLQSSTNSRGRYSICGVPLDATLTFNATLGELESGPIHVRSNEDGYTVLHLTIGGESLF
jgi:hypothetical protein